MKTEAQRGKVTCQGLPARQWQIHWCQPGLLLLSPPPPHLALLTSGMAFGTSVRFWCRQATCRLELSQTQVCGQRWAAACQVGPSGSSRGSSSTTETLWGLAERRRVRCSQEQGSHTVHSLSPSSCPRAPQMSSSFGPREAVITLSLQPLPRA